MDLLGCHYIDEFLLLAGVWIDEYEERVFRPIISRHMMPRLIGLSHAMMSRVIVGISFESMLRFSFSQTLLHASACIDDRFAGQLHCYRQGGTSLHIYKAPIDTTPPFSAHMSYAAALLP